MASSSSDPVAPQTFDFALTPSAHKRFSSSPSGHRLQTITETTSAFNAPPIPPRSVLRNSISQTSLQPPQSQHAQRNSLASSQSPPRAASRGRKASVESASTRTAPPAYSWIPDLIDSDDGNEPFEGEKLAALRKTDREKKQKQRGGWSRLVLIIIVAAIVVIGLAVGLGVGLTVGRHKGGNNSSSSVSNSTSSSSSSPFPLGQYSLVTALSSQSTNCTSNPATWSCYPYHTLNPSDSSSNSSSLATFNWVIAQTADTYATINTGSTPDTGIPANLSISTTSNPFSISFTNQSLTYISSSANATWTRYTFNVTMSKFTVPSTALTSDNTQSQCFFNQTMLTGTLYLSAPRNYPSGSLASSTSIGGSAQWPFAVEITQSSPGGADVPACYALNNGAIGNRITTGLTPQADSSRCTCDYKNF